jgi:ceramide glucosyltransferase
MATVKTHGKVMRHVAGAYVSLNRDCVAARTTQWSGDIIHVALALISVLVILSSGLSSLMSVAVLVLRAQSRRLPRGKTPISVLKPVRGLDDELEANLESFCRQSHPQYELIVGAAEPDDPALVVARRVRDRHPGVSLRVVSGQWPSGGNPKVRNLRHLLSAARYPTVLVSDGDVRVEPEYLRVMAGAIEQPKVGLVSNLIVGVGERTIGAAAENAQFNGFVVASTAAALLYARHPIVVGKSMLFRRDALTNAGGFAAAANVLAEDYLLGRAVAQAGYEVRVLGYSVRAVSRDRSMLRMAQRQQRWAQIRRHVAPAIFALEPLGSPLVWLGLFAVALLLCGSAALPKGWALAPTVVLPLGAVALQAVVAFSIRGSGPRLTDLLALPLASAISMLAWTRAWFDVHVVWRNQRFRISAGSQLRPWHSTARRADERLPEAA